MVCSNPAGLGQPHTTTSMVEQLPSGSQVQSSYEYDAAGNTESRQIDGDTQTLTWDVFGRAEKVTEADGKTTEYLYGPDGERLIVRDPQATTLYLPGMELRLPKGSTTPQGVRYYDHGGQAVAQWGAQGQFWLLGDHQGTAATSIGFSDLVVTRRYQTPYGEPRGTNPPLPFAGWPNAKGFVGGTIDTVAGLTHIGARHYDATLGQFISIDPIIDYTDPVQMHGYGYANWSPVTHSDPTGLIIGSDALKVANSIANSGGGKSGTANSIGAGACGASAGPFKPEVTMSAVAPDTFLDNWSFLVCNHKTRVCSSTADSGKTGDFGDFLFGIGKFLPETLDALEPFAMVGYDHLVHEGAIPEGGVDYTGAYESLGRKLGVDTFSDAYSVGHTTGVIGSFLTGAAGLARGATVSLTKLLAKKADVGGIGVKPSKQLRPVGAVLESVDDALKNVDLLRHKSSAQVESILRGTPGWRTETLGKGDHLGQGWLFREYKPTGARTGRMIRWHPGGGRHGPDPYWTVSSPKYGKQQVWQR